MVARYDERPNKPLRLKFKDNLATQLLRHHVFDHHVAKTLARRWRNGWTATLGPRQL